VLAVLHRVCCPCLQSLSVENLVDVWQASEDYSAPQLAKRCVLFALEHVTDIIAQYGGGMSGSAAAAAATATTLSGPACGPQDMHGAGSVRSSSAASDSSHDSGSHSTASPCSSSGSQVGGSVGSHGPPLLSMDRSFPQGAGAQVLSFTAKLAICKHARVCCARLTHQVDNKQVAAS
jgi:hypothetical protein